MRGGRDFYTISIVTLGSTRPLVTSHEERLQGASHAMSVGLTERAIDY